MAGMVPQDVYELTWVADPRLSPGGEVAAFVVWRIDREANRYASNIWVAPTDGSEEPRQVTFGTKRDQDPRWSPDGTRLAFTSDRDGEHLQLYVLPVDGGEARRLTACAEDVEEPAWSPDGTRLSFVSRVRDPEYDEEDDRRRRPRRIAQLQYKYDNIGWTFDRRRHLFVVPADGSERPRQITFGNHEDHSPAWSPDGNRIAFTSAREPDWDVSTRTDIYLVGAEGGEPQAATTGPASYDAASWSADGSLIASRCTPGVGENDEPRHTQIAVFEARGAHAKARGRRKPAAEVRVLTESLDRNCGPYPELREPIWIDDEILFAAEDAGNTHLYRVAATGVRAPELVLGGDQILTGYDAVDDVGVHAATTPARPPELFCGERQLTDVSREFVEGRELGEPERFTAVAPDGAEVEAWIVRPASFEEGEKYPLLLNVHGGPFAQYGNKFFDEFQVYAGAGYAVVYSNPRGSSGYSEHWARAIRVGEDGGGGWGTVDYDDVMAVVDEAVKRFEFVDTDRLGVMGGSYGGFMTSWIVGHNDRFRVAISERAVNQWMSMWGSSDIGWDLKGYFGKYLYEDPDLYLRLSPASYAKDVTTPLLILHSENDLRCPIEQGEQLFTTLRLLKREVEFVRFPAESHELTRSGNPAHRVMRFEIILDWLERHLR